LTDSCWHWSKHGGVLFIFPRSIQYISFVVKYSICVLFCFVLFCCSFQCLFLSAQEIKFVWRLVISYYIWTSLVYFLNFLILPLSFLLFLFFSALNKSHSSQPFIFLSVVRFLVTIWVYSAYWFVLYKPFTSYHWAAHFNGYYTSFAFRRTRFRT
jgi:hypothetical protein